MTEISRRDFNLRSALLLLSGVTITVSGCEEGGNPGGNSGNLASGDEEGTVSANHGHRAVITSAQMQGAGPLTLSIRGSADHPQTVELTALELTAIRGGSQVVKSSSLGPDGHNHLVTFNAEGPAPNY